MSRPGLSPPVSAVLDALRWFPLVPRPHPAPAPLADRLAEIRDLLRAAPTAADRLTTEAVAWNKAALLASDHHLPDLAHELCWEHHRRYDGLPAFDDRTARLALEPLVNLARLHRRSGRTDDALTVLGALRLAVDTRTDTTIDGHPVRTTRIPDDAHQHRRLRTWMWSVHLAEGIQALAAAGRWTEAHDHAQSHHGIGSRLLDGRQVAVIACLVAGESDFADDLLEASILAEPWEHAVAATLACGVRLARGRVDPARIDAVAGALITLEFDTNRSAFIERLRWCTAALAALADGSGRVLPGATAEGCRSTTAGARTTPTRLESALLAALGIRGGRSQHSARS